jgi:hypothetical protein
MSKDITPTQIQVTSTVATDVPDALKQMNGGLFMSKDQIYKLKQNSKEFRLGLARDSFLNGLSSLVNIGPEFDVIRQVGDSSLRDMTETDFMFLVTKPELLQKCTGEFGFKKAYGVDTMFKQSSVERVDDRYKSKAGIIMYTALDDDLKELHQYLLQLSID